MRIAFIHPRYPSSEGTGATHSATQIVKGLREAGHSIRVYCSREPPENVGVDGIEMRHLAGTSNHPHTNTRLNREIIDRIDELREFDVVHSYLMEMIPSIARVGMDPDVRTFVTLNAYGGTCAKNDLLYLDREQCEGKSVPKCLNCITRTGIQNNDKGYLYQTASQLFSLKLIQNGEKNLEYIDGFRAPSKHVRDNYAQFGYDPGKISVIPHPVNKDFIVPHQSDFSEPYKLLYVGALAHRKGVQKLVPILNALGQLDKEFRLTIIGTGPLKSELVEQATSFELENNVEFAGFVSNDALPEIYASHDCFLFPSIWEEPLARVYLEALATGTPIVTSDYGDVRTVVGEGGITTDSTREGFVNVLDELTEGDGLRRLSQGASETLKRYRGDKVVQQVQEMYHSVNI